VLCYFGDLSPYDGGRHRIAARRHFGFTVEHLREDEPQVCASIANGRYSHTAPISLRPRARGALPYWLSYAGKPRSTATRVPSSWRSEGRSRLSPNLSRPMKFRATWKPVAPRPPVALKASSIKTRIEAEDTMKTVNVCAGRY